MQARADIRAKISPLPDGHDRPLWSVMIPTYNCAHYLRQTLNSVLSQDPGLELMQIEVIDDCSTRDDPEAVVAELGRGRVGFYRQPRNIGHIGNFDTCLQRSRGRLVHLLHGDDYVCGSFYQRMGQLFDRHPEIGAAFCRHTTVDEQGNEKWTSPLEQPESGVLEDWLKRVTFGLPVQPPSIVVRRQVYERLGGFDPRMISCAEDWEMWARIAVHYPLAYEPETLAMYRDNSNSLTKRSLRSGQNIRDVRMATKIIGRYLPRPIAREAAKHAGKVWANWALYYADLLVANGDLEAAAVQLREGLKCNRSRKVLKIAAPLAVRISREWVKRTLRRVHASSGQ